MTKPSLLHLEPVRIAAQQWNITVYVRNVAIIKANLLSKNRFPPEPDSVLKILLHENWD